MFLNLKNKREIRVTAERRGIDFACFGRKCKDNKRELLDKKVDLAGWLEADEDRTYMGRIKSGMYNLFFFFLT